MTRINWSVALPAALFAAIGSLLAFALVSVPARADLGNSEVANEMRHFDFACDDPATEVTDTTAGYPGHNTLACENTSTTCMRIGGSGVGTLDGIGYGDGCPGGRVFSADIKTVYGLCASPLTIKCTSAR